jgi:hypothetical protein
LPCYWRKSVTGLFFCLGLFCLGTETASVMSSLRLVIGRGNWLSPAIFGLGGHGIADRVSIAVENAFFLIQI